MSNEKESIAKKSIWSSLILTVTKLVVGILTGSMGILSEAAHSLLDLGATILTFFAVRFGDKPADKNHPYGHGKIESVSALIETGLLFLTSIWIIYEAAQRLLTGQTEVEITWYAFAVVIFSIIIDFTRSQSLYKIARVTKSQALEADALHFQSDIWSSAVVLLGLIFVFLGFKGADSIAAIGVSIFVSVAGYRLGKRTIDVLVDTAPEGIADIAEDIASKVTGVIKIKKIRVRPLGPGVFIELRVGVNRKSSIAHIEEVKKNIERAILARLPEAEVLVYTESIQLNTETITDVVQVMAAKTGVPIHDITVDESDGKKFISYHLELAPNLALSEAHALASDLEQAIKKELGELTEINSHIEPLCRGSIINSDAAQKDIEMIETTIAEVRSVISELKSIHNVLVRKAGNRFLISFHCLAEPKSTLEDIHEATNRFEYLIKEKVHEVQRVVIHVEPEEK